MAMIAVPIVPEMLEKNEEYYADLRILDIGDPEVENVLKSTEDARTNRVAKETNDELKRVLKRVDHVSKHMYQCWYSLTRVHTRHH